LVSAFHLEAHVRKTKDELYDALVCIAYGRQRTHALRSGCERVQIVASRISQSELKRVLTIDVITVDSHPENHGDLRKL
jgi:hypothetical protein